MNSLNVIRNTTYGLIIGMLLAFLGDSISTINIEGYWIFYFLLPLAIGGFFGWMSYTIELNKEDANVSGVEE